MPYLFTLLSITCICLGLPLRLCAQSTCTAEQSKVIIEILTDGYGYETSWTLTGTNGVRYDSVTLGTYRPQRLYRDTICIPNNGCTNFTIYDGFGDGIAPPGYYLLLLNGDTIRRGGNFNVEEVTFLECQKGEVCSLALPVTAGLQVARFEDTWYEFIPDSTGIYRINTCNLNTCDTKIWIYDHCSKITIAEDNQSTIFFNDDENTCAPRAVVRGYFYKNKPYYIRMGDKINACKDSIRWELAFEGPVKGCMDLTSCNYNPLATISDGRCYPQGDRRCPKGPDLRIQQDTLLASLRLDTIHATDLCFIYEGCLRGYGVRDIIRFTTQIDNIGERDYYIGKPEINNRLFSYNNCHNHFHYDSYAEYLLFKPDGTKMPAGYKNGFCVTDFGCEPGQTPKFSCDNMGISAGCYDTYWSELECQWIDVTDMPDGSYTMVVRINWTNSPDAIGQVEKDIDNNWAQACIRLDRSSGKLRLFVERNCMTYRDCAGVPFGNAQIDCDGICGGEHLVADIDDNRSLNILDAEQYVTQLLGNDLEPNSCNDLDADGAITVYDAVLLTSCLYYGASHQHSSSSVHNHCQFPSGINNPNDTATLSILEANWEEGYLDIGIKNPTATINAYQFRISGGAIGYVENLVDDARYPIIPRTSMTDGTVIGISYRDSVIQKSVEIQPLCRIHFLWITSDSLRIESIQELINGKHERIVPRIGMGAAPRPEITSIPSFAPLKNVSLSPNPFHDEATLRFHNPNQEVFQLDLFDVNSRLIKTYKNVTDERIRIQRQSLPSGIYFYRLISQMGYALGKFIIQ